jgi:hypothetical protein
MATQNKTITTTIQALEDLDTHQYIAIALNDGKVANSASEAGGILQNKPKTNEFATLAYFGESKFKAGGAIAKGAEITIATSGYFTQADSNDDKVGMAKAAVTSGSVGTGYFSFPNKGGSSTGLSTFAVTAADAIGQGFAYTTADNKLANNEGEAIGVAPAAIASGDTGFVVIGGGPTQGTVGGGNLAAGAAFMVGTSGYLIAVTSGHASAGHTLDAITSGSTGNVVWRGGSIVVA